MGSLFYYSGVYRRQRTYAPHIQRATKVFVNRLTISRILTMLHIFKKENLKLLLIEIYNNFSYQITNLLRTLKLVKVKGNEK